MNDDPMLELAAMLAEECARDLDLQHALQAAMARLGVADLSEFVEREPEQFKIFAHAVIGMVDQLPNVRGSRDA